MAKSQGSTRRPQPKHKKNKKSQHDKRNRLQNRNPQRKKTAKAKVPLTGAMQRMASALQAAMDRRIAFRLAIVVAGMLLADDRRTASAWFVAAGVQDDWDRFYECLIRVGRCSGKLATVVLGLVVQKLAPKFGDRILLGKRAAHQEGWQTIAYHCRGVEVTRQYKTFLATSELVSGQIRVVRIRFEDGSWAPYFCTDTSAEVRDILEAVAARWAIEEHFHDVKEVWGAGQQQVRNVWSNIGCWHLNQWLYALIELCCWDMSKSKLTDRQARGWDNPDRRPSHADRRRSVSREMLQAQFLAVLPDTPDRRKFRNFVTTLLSLCV